MSKNSANAKQSLFTPVETTEDVLKSTDLHLCDNGIIELLSDLP